MSNLPAAPPRRPLAVALIACSLALPSLAAGKLSEERVERRVGLMGTTLTLSVEAVDRSTALGASEAAVRAIEQAEARLSTWRDDSELSRLNRSAPGEGFELSPELARDLAWAERMQRVTGGAFDPGIGALVEVWGLRSGGRQPSDAEIDAARVPNGFAALELDGRTARRMHPRLRIEEGGFGKGIGLDDALVALRAAGATSAVLDLGGQIVLFGKVDTPDANWETTFGIADPSDRDRPAVLQLSIDRGSLATSGNSEHGIVHEGARYGHILDPRSGLPAADFGSLTVWVSDDTGYGCATRADCLSTGLYVMGPDAALGWAEEHAGVEIIVLERVPEGLRARASSGLTGRLSAVADLRVEFTSHAIAAGLVGVNR